ncbi:von Willebrand factor type A domain-containing protein [Flagellimonas sp. HMM57]|uniref:vWA domain-containing protein n=1 Tax=unclassified Flagellimonas TaxID=2644544 RepID=UPI0013D10EC9|nr:MULTISPECIES: VWA domain-containing protein [unclassified Flagellimonas]UII76032.1 von Willebrand factor type A domain-containing protein [Flagellimonas sp. HMM57]
MKKIFFFFIVASTLQLSAQSKNITGTVTDAANQPLPGVNVMVEGTSKGTQTDFDGHYSIAANQGQMLVFSYIGFKTFKAKIGTGNIVDVSMEEDSQALEEVVIVAYGSNVSFPKSPPSPAQIKRQKRKEYHSSIAQTLQGRVAGVQITNKSAVPSTAPNIKIRGTSSIKAGKEPLYIVDGVPIQKMNNSVVAKIDPKDVDKINIYKGAKARQMFGSSANDGCIVITTKKGNYQIENDENYAHIAENKFEHVALSPLSTFSIDVDKASYSNVRRMINNGQQIPIDAVKIEEMVNYFNYDYPQPTEHPFSINTEVVQTPWNKDTKLVRIGLQGKSYTDEELPPSNLTFLIDVSGSMGSANKLPLLKSAFKLLVNQLREKDKVSIVVYAGAAGQVLSPTRGSNKEKIMNAIENLESGGSTAGGAGIELAYKLAQKNFIKDGNNRVILATDGDFNVGPSSDKAMVKLIEEKRETGVFLSVLGFGMGNYKDSKMEKLADKGNGNHAYIDTMQEAQKVFGQEFGGTLYTIAKDVKIQVEFNPQAVKAYRLIGYENRMLADEDFIDDTKDAGELGSGHTVTALYEVIPKGVESPYLKKVHDLKYSNLKVKEESNDLLTVKFRYKKPDGNVSTEINQVLKDHVTAISPDFSFAASVALFGLHLRKSQYTNNTSLDDVINLAENGIVNDNQGYKTEFIRLVKSYNESM